MKRLAKRPNSGSLEKHSQPEKVTIFKYIATQNPDAANTLLSKYGIRGGKTEKEIAYKLAVLVKKGGEDALKKIMDMHPDKEYLTKQVEEEKAKEKTLSACGCSMGADGYMNCCGSANADGSFSCEGNPNCTCHLKEKGAKVRPADAKVSADGNASPAPVAAPVSKEVVNNPMFAFTPTHTVILVSAVIVSMALFFSRKG
jgi:hypothetical protein